MKKKSIIIGLIIIALEIFVFNFSSIKSVFYKEYNVDINKIIMNNVIYDEITNKYYIEDEDCYIEIEVNNNVNNIYLDIESLSSRILTISLEYTDSANSYYNKFDTNNKNEIILVNDILKSKYIDIYSLGQIKKIKINFESPIATQFQINRITFNKVEPVHFNFIRVFSLFFIILIPYNYFYNTKFKNLINKNENKVLILTISLFIILIIFLYKNIGYLPDNLHQDYYSNEYVDAISSGALSLDRQIGLDYNFEGLSNVYDFSERKEKNINFPWDVSYYNDSYYIYFGIFPALIMILFKNLFGVKISSLILSCFFSVIATIFGSLVIKEIIEKYTKSSFGLKLLMIVFFLFNCRLLLVIPKTRFYEMINVCGFSFSLVGIYLYMLFDKNNKKRYLFLGSLFLSLLLLIRPSMILASFLGIYIIFKKINRKNIIYLIMPFIIIGTIAMCLNYIRFGNVFEFGITYQLGILDNNYSKFNLMAILNGIYTYLFRIPIFDTTFPYVFNNVSMINYFGFYFNTSTGNGIIPMSILGLIVPFIIKKMDKKTVKFIVICLISGILLLSLDAIFGGSIKRYSLEFNWLFLIPIILIAIKNLKNKKILYTLVLISCLINFLVIFDLKNDDTVEFDNEGLFYDLMYYN